MDFNKVNDGLTVSGQIQPEDMAVLVERGFASVIVNRPDEEVEEGLRSDVMEQAAAEAGLLFLYLPIYPGQFTDEMVAETKTAMETMEGPIYAYCRSGTRSVTAWAMSQKGQAAVDDILHQAAGAGYDLTPMTPYFLGK